MKNDSPMTTESSLVREFDLDVRVRYSETDAMGFLHHANYFVFFEMGRTELFRAQGGNYREFEERGLFLVVVRIACSYKTPAKYDDLLTLKTRLAKVTPAKLEHAYELRRGEQIICTGESTLACINREGRIQLIPDVLPGMMEFK